MAWKGEVQREQLVDRLFGDILLLVSLVPLFTLTLHYTLILKFIHLYIYRNCLINEMKHIILLFFYYFYPLFGT